VLVLASTTVDPQVWRGVVLAVAYGLGLGLPFVLIAAGLDRAGRASGWLRRHQRTIQVVGGVMLVLVGLLMVTGLWQSMNTWLQTELVNGFKVSV
jgi:cytochrome c-type biogenesis protein